MYLDAEPFKCIKIEEFWHGTHWYHPCPGRAWHSHKGIALLLYSKESQGWIWWCHLCQQILPNLEFYGPRAPGKPKVGLDHTFSHRSVREGLTWGAALVFLMENTKTSGENHKHAYLTPGTMLDGITGGGGYLKRSLRELSLCLTNQINASKQTSRTDWMAVRA